MGKITHNGKNTPDIPGFYWARTSAMGEDWDRIVMVKGRAPYLEYIGWDFERNVPLSGTYPDFYFGPKIEMPELTFFEEEVVDYPHKEVFSNEPKSKSGWWKRFSEGSI